MKKVIKLIKDKFVKIDFKLTAFLIVAFLIPLFVDFIKVNNIFDILLLLGSIVTGEKVFKDTCEHRYQYYMLALLLIFGCVSGYKFISVKILNYDANDYTVALNFSIRMLTLFMVSYPIYQKYIKKEE